MTARTALLTLAVLLAAAPPAPAQEKYDIKLKKAAQGESEMIYKTEVETNTSYLTDAGKKVKEQEPSKKETRTVYRETVVEKAADSRWPTKIKRRYDKAEITTDGKTTTLPYQGKTVLIDKEGDEYRFRIEGGGEWKEKDVALLRREFAKRKDTEPDFARLFLPGRPVAVGETWKLETAAILKEYRSADGPQADEARVKGTAKLVRAYPKDGRQFGVLSVELVIPIKAIPAAKGLEIEPGTRLVISADLDICIDGSATLGIITSHVNMDLRAKIVAEKMGIVSLTRSTLTEIHKAAPR